ncbi:MULTISPECIES: hypothetical protein [Flavobacteriaceae]|uniref:hypothetical protein n=1 Tax=Flavobacteriaceae TaxID=49546 RepID=UPI003A91BF5C
MKYDTFFFKVNITYTDKNKLYKEFREFITSLDGTIIRNSICKSQFKKHIKTKLEQLHEKHKRCKELHLGSNNGFGEIDKGTEILFVPGSWSASIYPVKKKFD